MKVDSLGNRMKGYEAVSSANLMRRCPVIVRVDGRAFHTLTKGLDRPFDAGLVNAMSQATQAVAEEMQGCKLAYTQSDEVSFLLLDTDTLETQPWFGYDHSKVVSLSASLMTAHFGRHAPVSVAHKIATFDSRVFNVPADEVTNYFLWRAKDWKRNSIQMLAQSHFSPKQLHGRDLENTLYLLANSGVFWEDLPPHLRCGRFFVPRVDGSPRESKFTTVENAEPNFPTIDALVHRATWGDLK